MKNIKKIGAIGLSALIVASAPNIVGLTAINDTQNVAYAAEEEGKKVDFKDGTSIQLVGTPKVAYGDAGDRVKTIDMELKVNGFKKGDYVLFYEGLDFVNSKDEDVSKVVSIFGKKNVGSEVKLKGSDVVVGVVEQFKDDEEESGFSYGIKFNENIENLKDSVISISARYDVKYPIRYKLNAKKDAGKLPVEFYALGNHGQDFEKLYETSLEQKTDDVYITEGARMSHGSLVKESNDKGGVNFDYDFSSILSQVKAGDTLTMSLQVPKTMKATVSQEDSKLYKHDFLYLSKDYGASINSRGYLEEVSTNETIKPSKVDFNEETGVLSLEYKFDKDYDSLIVRSPKIAISTETLDKVFASKDGALKEDSFLSYSFNLADSQGQTREKVDKGQTKFIQIPESVLSAIGDYSTTKEEEEKIPFNTIYKADENLVFKNKETKIEGKDGKNKIIYTLDANGRVVDTKKEPVEEVVNEIIHVGNITELNEKIPFKVIKRKNPKLPAGTKETKIQDGSEGTKLIKLRYQVDSNTGEFVGDGERYSEEITKKPVDEIWEYNDDEVRKNKDDYTPNVTEKTIHVGEDVPADSLVINKENLPEGTIHKYKPGTEPDNTKPGDYNVTIVTTYPDGSTDETPTVVHVIEKVKDTPKDNEETPKDNVIPHAKDITVKVGTEVKPGSLITNVSELPEGTKFTYKPGTEPNINKVGKYNVVIVAEYPDGKLVETPAVVNVIDVAITTKPVETVKPQAQEKTVKVGTEVPAKDLIVNKDKFPADTKYEYKKGTEPDINKVGDYKVVVVSTYPNGESEETPTIVHVISENADSSKNKVNVNPLKIQTGGAITGGAGVVGILAAAATSYFNKKKKD